MHLTLTSPSELKWRGSRGKSRPMTEEYRPRWCSTKCCLMTERESTWEDEQNQKLVNSNLYSGWPGQKWEKLQISRKNATFSGTITYFLAKCHIFWKHFYNFKKNTTFQEKCHIFKKNAILQKNTMYAIINMQLVTLILIIFYRFPIEAEFQLSWWIWGRANAGQI